MTDLFAVIAETPLASVVLATFFFSLSLFPLGLMLGGECDSCCTQCDKCETGRLPDTVTVTFDGYPDTSQNAGLVEVSFFSCSGFGGRATLLAPGGTPGPMSEIEMTDGGGGYAHLGREEPTVVVQSSGNGDATFVVSLSETEECSGRVWEVSSVTVTAGGTGYQNRERVNFEVQGDGQARNTGSGTIATYLEEPTVEVSAFSGSGAEFVVTFASGALETDPYTIESVDVTAGGTGYQDGTIANVTPTGTSTEDSQAYLEIQTVRDEPTLALTTGIFSNGTGATYEPVLTENTASGRSVWRITSVDVSEGGEGFYDGESVLVVPGEHVEAQAFFGYALTRNDQPTLTSLVLSETGSGCVLEPTLSETTLPDGKDAWRVIGFSIVDPGLSYVAGQPISITVDEGQEIEPIDITIQVDEEGRVTGFNVNDAGLFAIVGVLDTVEIVFQGEYYADTGVVESVNVIYGGEYYDDTGVVASVTVDFPGSYYQENEGLSAYVPEIEVFISQSDPSAGSGAVLTPVVDTNTSSDTFGQITDVTITNGGVDYLAWENTNAFCLGDYLNGRPIVLAKSELLGTQSNGCEYRSWVCGTLGPGNFKQSVSFLYGYYESSSLVSGPHWNAVLTDQIEDCSDFSLSVPSSAGFAIRPGFENVSATIVSGGGSIEEAIGPEGLKCGSCCLTAESPEEITVSVTNLVQAGDNPSLPDGNYVCFRSPFNDGLYNRTRSGEIVWHTGINSLRVTIEPCAYLASEPSGVRYKWQEIFCGDTCNRKCQVSVSYDGMVYAYPDIGTYGAFGAGFDVDCSRCLDTPICDPSGSYVLRASDFTGTPYVSATVS